MLEQRLTIAIINLLDTFGIAPTDTICDLVNQFVMEVLKNA